MKQSILGGDRSTFQKRLRANTVLCACVLGVIVIIHLLCTGLRTDRNHTWMLIANIAVDIIGGSFLIARLSICVFPCKKLLQLYDLATQEASGQVQQIGCSIIHYIGINCYEIFLPDRRLFLPVSPIRLNVGTAYRFRLKGNLIVEAQDDE